MSYKAGDCDDLTLLYCALLEGLGVESAFIAIPGHIYAAFALDTAYLEAVRLLIPSDLVIPLDGKAWVPVEITALDGGGLRAWNLGSREWKENSEGGTAMIYPVREAWSPFPAAGIGGNELPVAPDPSFTLRYEKDLNAFVQAQLKPRLTELDEKTGAGGDNPAIINRKGILYAQWGLLDEAEGEFRKITGNRTPYVSALANLGNIAFSREDYGAVAEHFKRA
jgi:hypothetical protein